MKCHVRSLVLLVVGLVASGCGEAKEASEPQSALVGAWRAKIQFSAGVFAEVKDLEFLYAYNEGGTMTESSNYDEAANSSPPAYGVWRETGPKTFETKYLFWQTRVPVAADGPGNEGGWLPAGHGVLTEKITLSADGNSYTSTVHYDSFDQAGQPMPIGGDATGSGTRIVF
ncbi:MAG: hypothetical protein ABJC19_08520 [Gemmatimonadota bacterium]